MKFRMRAIGAAALLVLTSPAWSPTITNSLVSAQTINKPSVQVRLQVHKGYNGDPETWSCKGDQEATAMFTRDYRAPFVVPEKV